MYIYIHIYVVQLCTAILVVVLYMFCKHLSCILLNIVRYAQHYIDKDSSNTIIYAA